MKNDLPWKKTSKIKNRNISATSGPILLKFETQADGTKPNVKMKRICVEDDPMKKYLKILKFEISQQL